MNLFPNLRSYKYQNNDRNTSLPSFPNDYKEEEDLELGLEKNKEDKEDKENKECDNKGYLINFLVYIRDYFKR